MTNNRKLLCPARAKEAWGRFLDILYPVFCPGCAKRISGMDPFPLCENCRGALPVDHAPFCPRCGTVTEYAAASKGCASCASKTFHFDRALHLFAYEGIIKKGIIEFKFKRKTAWADLFAENMALFLKQYAQPDEIDMITAVPLHKKRFAERGFNQSEVMAVRLAELLCLPYSCRILKRTRNTPSQTSLPGQKRRKNMRGAFACLQEEKIAGKSLLLLDDVFTTGATVDECARVLKDAKAGKVTVITVAR